MDNILMQVRGHKRVILFSPRDANHLYLTGKMTMTMQAHSQYLSLMYECPSHARVASWLWHRHHDSGWPDSTNFWKDKIPALTCTCIKCHRNAVTTPRIAESHPHLMTKWPSVALAVSLWCSITVDCLFICKKNCSMCINMRDYRLIKMAFKTNKKAGPWEEEKNLFLSVLFTFSV